MVIPVDTLLIKQLEKQLNDIIVISIITWQDDKGNNSIMENLSIWPISQQSDFQNPFAYAHFNMFVDAC